MKQAENSTEWGLWCQKQVSSLCISNYTTQITVGCNYLSLPCILASGTNVLNYNSVANFLLKYSQQTPHSSPARASYGVSCELRIWTSYFLAPAKLRVTSSHKWPNCKENQMYRQTSNISRTSVDNKIVDHSDVVGASPVDAAPTTPSFSA